MKRLLVLLASALVICPTIGFAVADADQLGRPCRPDHPVHPCSTTTITSTTSTTSTTTTSPAPTTTQPSSRFELLPVGAALPSDTYCAGHVRSAREVRHNQNAVPNRFGEVPNQTRGQPGVWRDADPAKTPFTARVTGDFTGTTDEIIQWAACKWGIDEDVVRAQIAKESWWDQANSLGDWGTNAANCDPRFPLGTDGHAGQCPESLGLGQTRYPYMRSAFPLAYDSSAFNLDVTYAIWRSCFEGTETWLNTVERGRQYAAGDMWGCVGRWFAGRWYTQPAIDYIAAVQRYLTQQVWTTPDFIAYGDSPPSPSRPASDNHPDRSFDRVSAY
jgi:hypothetical protein